MKPKNRPNLECPLVYPEIEIENVNEIEIVDTAHLTAIRDFRLRMLSFYMKQDYENLLDVSCGNGRNLKYYQWKGFKVAGTEYDDQLIEKNLRDGFFCIKVDLNKDVFPFEDNSFDVVTCTDVIEHLQDPKYAIKELYRVAKKMILITTPVGRSYDVPNDHVHHFDQESLIDILTVVGQEYVIGSFISKPEDYKFGSRFFLIVIEK